MNMTNKEKVCIAVLTLDMTTAQIVSYLRGLCKVKREGNHVFFTISGYEDDIRPLGKIPEVVCFLQSMWDFGLASVLSMDPILEKIEEATTAFGALKLWLIVTDYKGYNQGKHVVFDKETKDLFVEDWNISNRILEIILK